MLFFFWQMVTTVWNSTRQELQIALCKTALPTGHAFLFGGDSKRWVRQGCLPDPPGPGCLTRGTPAPGWRPRASCLWARRPRWPPGLTEAPVNREQESTLKQMETLLFN